MVRWGVRVPKRAVCRVEWYLSLKHPMVVIGKWAVLISPKEDQDDVNGISSRRPQCLAICLLMI